MIVGLNCDIYRVPGSRIQAGGSLPLNPVDYSEYRKIVMIIKIPETDNPSSTINKTNTQISMNIKPFSYGPSLLRNDKMMN